MGIHFLNNCKGWIIGRPKTKTAASLTSQSRVPVHDIISALSLIKNLVEAHKINTRDGIYDSDQVVLKKANETLEKVYCHTEKAMVITERLRHLARPVDRLTKKDCISLWKETKYVLRSIKKKNNLKDVEIVNLIPRNLPLFKMSQSDVREILHNIILNAVQVFNQCCRKKPHQVVLKGCILHEPSSKPCLAIQVMDTGPGMLPSELKSIFQPFYTSGKNEGSGLGLFIARQLVERNGGAISVQSFKGKGTTFQVEFPL